MDDRMDWCCVVLLLSSSVVYLAHHTVHTFTFLVAYFLPLLTYLGYTP